MEFKCHHCGECCRNVSAQINLSIADLARICQFLKCGLKEIMPKVGIIPFLSDNDNFDYELGLNLPCQFRKNSRCTIYPARPLNCRMFPYFILNTEIINPDFFCLKEERNYSEEEKDQYKRYTKLIGDLILKEAEITEKFYQDNNLKQRKEISLDLPPFFSEKKIIELKIRKALTLVDLDNYNNLNEQLQQFIEKNNFTSFEEINQNEPKLL